MKYISVTESTAELVVSRSRFLAFCYPISGEEEATERLKALRKEYHDATHVCYAAVYDETGSLSRFSDDGEPGGTAGAPIMDAIRAASLKKCLVAVVRYFGGVKLGTGGLTRAYGSVAADCLRSAGRVEFELCEVYRCKTDFASFNKISGLRGISDIAYGEGVAFEYACPVGEDMTRLVDKTGGKIEYVKCAERRYKQLTNDA